MSSQPIKLDKALQKGRIVQFKLKDNETKDVPFGCAWLILGGVINHVTGTQSKVYAFNNNPLIFASIIDDTAPSGLFPLFNGVADLGQSRYTPVILTWGITNLTYSNIQFQGAVNSYLKMQVLEWEI